MDRKTVHRIIRIHYPNGTVRYVEQSVMFKRAGGSADPLAWIPADGSNGMYAAFAAPELAGYTAVADPRLATGELASSDQQGVIYRDIYYVANGHSLSGSTSGPASLSGHSLASVSQAGSSTAAGQTTVSSGVNGQQPAASVKEHQLPQTGNGSHPSTVMGALTGIVASLGALLGLGKKKKKTD